LLQWKKVGEIINVKGTGQKILEKNKKNLKAGRCKKNIK